ncbi:MAG: hypothetical protein AB2L14_02755 [Candidatus Xenobiia bacterium LiM19]
MGGQNGQTPQQASGQGTPQAGQQAGQAGQVGQVGQMTSQMGLPGAAQGSPSVNQLVTDYKQAEQSGAQLKDDTKQMVKTTLQGAGVDPAQVMGQQDQGKDATANQLNGMMEQFKNLTGGGAGACPFS